jgi:hypothetical protein
MESKLPGGSEELIMKTLSLARIMYGTSEEFHVSHGVNASPGSASIVSPSASHADKSTVEMDTLGELLHRAWTNLSGRK